MCITNLSIVYHLSGHSSYYIAYDIYVNIIIIIISTEHQTTHVYKVALGAAYAIQRFCRNYV